MSAAVGALPPRPKRLLLHVGLFLATFLTTTAAGAIYVHGQKGGGSVLEAILPIADGLSYSVPLMLILLAHELGHYLVARYHGVDASLPYFIPLPPPFLLGTMGAVIGMRDVTSDRKKLIDIGAAGPLAGLLVAIPVLWYGLRHSQVGPLVPNGLQEGNSILYALLKHAVKGSWLPDGRQDIFLHPTAWAGWAGLLVTMLNLIPIGQLDGGHVATAYFGNRYNEFAARLHRLLPFGALAVALWVWRLVRLESGEHWNPSVAMSIALGGAFPWLVVYLVLRIVRALSGGDNHPPVDDQPLLPSRRLLFWIMVVVFVLVFMPVPIRMTLVGVAPPTVTAAL
ncbi:MAG TPA: site-2 protease family protein [Polyangia bacterium]|jgi:membrane-associated protease RseP (regulator of RpoE activity)|nr:site-2 protease family protein [Polyangia bacterium]